MRIKEIILESIEDDGISEETIRITKNFGGGKIYIWTKANEQTGEIDNYCYSYINDGIDKNSPIVTCQKDDYGKKIYHHDKFPQSRDLDKTTSNVKAKEIFAAEVSPYLDYFFRNGYHMNTQQNESISSDDIWNKDTSLKRAATLMDRIAQSADRHDAKIRGLMENTEPKNPQDTLRDIFRK